MQRLVFLLVVACGGSSKPPVANTGGGAAPAPAATVTLKDLQNGDRACYVVVTTAEGQEQSLPGDFELCKGGKQDASALIGKQIVYTTKRDNVLAAACEGNADCGKSDIVDLVVTITAAQ